MSSELMFDDYEQEAEGFRKILRRRGCFPALIAVLVLLGAGVILWILQVFGEVDDDASCEKAIGVVLGESAQADPCAADTTGATTTTTEGATPDAAGPPSEDDLPEGAILFQGSSGGPIGCITCDGQSRFLSLERDGVGVGNATITEFQSEWTLDGEVLEFGARLGAPNKGRYGVNLFFDGATYGPGVALEIGEQSAVYQWSPERDGTVTAGQQAVIIVGEGGTVDDEGVPIPTGEYELEWWFVFQPG